jgi:calpain family cysteine protease
MTTERGSKETKSQKTPAAKPESFHFADQQAIELSRPTLDLTHQNILRLQHTIGNAAVLRMLAQRQADALTDETTDEEAPPEEATPESETTSAGDYEGEDEAAPDEDAADREIPPELESDETNTGMRIPINFDLLSALVPGMTAAKNPDLPWSDRKAQYKPVAGGTLYGPSGKPEKEEVKQGGLGDCYLLAAVIAVANANPQLIKNMIKDNGDGTYDVTLHENGMFASSDAGKRKTQVVTVTADFPTNDKGQPLYAQPFQHSDAKHKPVGGPVMWAMLIEKAYAQLEGGYDELNGSIFHGEKGLKALTGAKIETYSVTDFSADVLLKNFDYNLKNSNAITAGINKSINPFDWKLIDQLHIVTGHVYAVVGVDLTKRTVDLHNPHGENHQKDLSVENFQRLFSDYSVAVLNPKK